MNTQETIIEFSGLSMLWEGDDYMQQFFLDMSKKDLEKLTDNQKDFFKKSVSKFINRFKKESTDPKVMADLKGAFICYRDQIKPLLDA